MITLQVVFVVLVAINPSQTMKLGSGSVHICLLAKCTQLVPYSEVSQVRAPGPLESQRRDRVWTMLKAQDKMRS